MRQKATGNETSYIIICPKLRKNRLKCVQAILVGNKFICLYQGKFVCVCTEECYVLIKNYKNQRLQKKTRIGKDIV